VRDGTLLAAAEMLAGGVTCCNDMYFYPQAAAEAFLQAGMRAVLGMIVLEFPSNYASDADDYLAKGLAVRDRFKDEPLLGFSFAPHAPYTVPTTAFAASAPWPSSSACRSTSICTRPTTRSKRAWRATACARSSAWRGWGCSVPT
jgi:hypothetical protein